VQPKKTGDLNHRTHFQAFKLKQRQRSLRSASDGPVGGTPQVPVLRFGPLPLCERRWTSENRSAPYSSDRDSLESIDLGHPAFIIVVRSLNATDYLNSDKFFEGFAIFDN
jgi:hypothetical protein